MYLEDFIMETIIKAVVSVVYVGSFFFLKLEFPFQ